MILQRNQASVSMFNGTSLAFLTIVCAVLGMVTSLTSESPTGHVGGKDTVTSLNSGNKMKGEFDAMRSCENGSGCFEAFSFATKNLLNVAKFSVLNMPKISLIMYCLSFAFLFWYLQPITSLVMYFTDSKAN